MKRNRLLFGAALVLMFGGLVGFSGDAYAQKTDPSKKAATTNDKAIASKEGVSGSLGSKKIDAEKLPGKLEMGFAFGSVVAMIAAIKYL